MAHKPPVITSKTQEGTKLLDRRWSWPACNGIQFGGVGAHTSYNDNVTKVINFSLGERALGELELPLIPGQEFEDKTKMLQIFLNSSTVNKYVIEEHQHELAKAWVECGVHCIFKGAVPQSNQMT